MEQPDTYRSLVVISLLAFTIPFAVSRLRWLKVPAVVAEILVGAALGGSALGVIAVDQHIEFLAEFGFAYLMFVSGLEIDLRLLRPGRVRGGGWRGVLGNPLALGMAMLAGTLTVSGVAGYALLRAGLVSSAPFAALVLATTSVGIVVPTLKERGEAGTPLGQSIIVAASVADLGTMLLLTAVVLLHVEGIGLELAFVPLVLLAAGAAYLLLVVAWRVRPVRRLFGELAHASTQIKVRGALALMMVFLALSQLVGVELILGAFLAGVLVGGVSEVDRGLLRTKLEAIGYGFFIPIFFIVVGSRFDAAALGDASAFGLVGGLVVAAFAAKVLPALILTVRFSLRDALASGLLLSARLSLIIAAADIGLRAGLIDQTMESAVLIVAVVACLLSPVAYAQLRPRDEVPHQKFVVAGAGRLGRELIERLVSHGRPVVAIDHSRERLDGLEARPERTVLGSAGELETLTRAGLQPGDVLLAVTESDEVNLRACRLARDRIGVERLVARDNDPVNAEDFRREDVVPMNLYLAGALVLENLAVRPGTFDLLTDAAEGRGLFEVEVKNADVCGRPISGLPFKGSQRLVCIRREGDLIMPTGDTRLAPGDLVTAFGSDTEQEDLEAMLVGADAR